MNNYYFNKINTLSISSKNNLYGGLKFSWDQRLDFCEKYIRKYYIMHIITAQQKLMNRKISEETAVQIMKKYFTILNEIEEKGFIAYFVKKGREELEYEARKNLHYFKTGRITEEALKNKTPVITQHFKDYFEIEEDNDMSKKFAIVQAEGILLSAQKVNSVNLVELNKYISDNIYSATFEQCKNLFMSTEEETV